MFCLISCCDKIGLMFLVCSLSIPEHSFYQSTCMPDKENIINEVIEEIWEHPCPAYARFREKIKHKAEEIFKERISISLDSIHIPVDTTKRKYHWFN